jgi:protease I
MPRVAILIENNFEDSELIIPRDALRSAGIDVSIIGPAANQQYKGKKGATITSDRAASDVKAADFDAIVVPGGHAPERMRMCHAMVDLVRDFDDARKPVAAICHGPQLLISANILRGRMVTCYPSIAIDVKNAGGRYVDRPVVEDGHVITSRKPDDLPQFNDALLRQIAQRAVPS